MEFPVVFRLIALAVVGFWLVQIARTIRKPPDWQPQRADQSPFRVTRNTYLMAGLLGVIGGASVFAASFVLFP